ncbi:IS5/IS1182 family transposase, partial [Janibacter hoylei]|nr:IS5/IS1182 family transposase [Janibacter hoylei]
TAYRGRHVVECRFAKLKQWRALACRYDKLALTYRAAVVLHAVIAWTQRLSDTP